MLSGHEAGIRDRDLQVEYLSGADEFAVALIGRDGGEKLRASEPLPATKLFQRIDEMPMRRRELREREPREREPREREPREREPRERE